MSILSTLQIALTSEGKSSPERRKGRVCTPSWTEKTRQQADTRLLHLPNQITLGTYQTKYRLLHLPSQRTPVTKPNTGCSTCQTK